MGNHPPPQYSSEKTVGCFFSGTSYRIQEDVLLRPHRLSTKFNPNLASGFYLCVCAIKKASSTFLHQPQSGSCSNCNSSELPQQQNPPWQWNALCLHEPMTFRSELTFTQTANQLTFKKVLACSVEWNPRTPSAPALTLSSLQTRVLEKSLKTEDPKCPKHKNCNWSCLVFLPRTGGHSASVNRDSH